MHITQLFLMAYVTLGDSTRVYCVRFHIMICWPQQDFDFSIFHCLHVVLSVYAWVGVGVGVGVWVLYVYECIH